MGKQYHGQQAKHVKLYSNLPQGYAYKIDLLKGVHSHGLDLNFWVHGTLPEIWADEGWAPPAPSPLIQKQ